MHTQCTQIDTMDPHLETVLISILLATPDPVPAHTQTLAMDINSHLAILLGTPKHETYYLGHTDLHQMSWKSIIFSHVS